MTWEELPSEPTAGNTLERLAQYFLRAPISLQKDVMERADQNRHPPDVGQSLYPESVR